MPTLIIQQVDGQVGCRVEGRLLIGRRLTNDIIINDVAVSRIHAWIDVVGDQYFLADNSSRTGVRLNGKPATGRRPLADGDRIEIGPARLTFYLKDQLPDGISLLSRPSPVRAEGTLFNCICGAPLWVGADDRRSRGRCRHCGRSVEIPHPAGEGDPALPTAGQPVCSICQCAILAGEQTTDCPSCKLVFHVDCWSENLGCSAYGCDQVNVLADRK